MCGIAGVVRFAKDAQIDTAVLRRMCAAMIHRGPDDEGIYSEGKVGLAVRRLSIIDLATGHQPISNEDGTLWIVFNGEIYNHLTLREQLIARGHRYRPTATPKPSFTSMKSTDEPASTICVACLPLLFGTRGSKDCS